MSSPEFQDAASYLSSVSSLSQLSSSIKLEVDIFVCALTFPNISDYLVSYTGYTNSSLCQGIQLPLDLLYLI